MFLIVLTFFFMTLKTFFVTQNFARTDAVSKTNKRRYYIKIMFQKDMVVHCL